MPKSDDGGSPPPPPCRLLFRTKDGVELHTLGSPSTSDPPSKSKLLDGSTTLAAFSPDGSAAFVHRPGVGVVRLDLSDSSTAAASDDGGATPFLEGSAGVQLLSLSPLGTYVVTWERPAKVSGGGESAAPPPNLKIWSSSSGRYLHGFKLKNVKRETFPVVRWSYDEKYAFHLATNEVHVYPGGCFSREDGEDGEAEVRYVGKVRCPGAASFSLPEISSEQYTGSDTYFLSAFVPEVKGKPARVSLLRYPGGESVASKSFYRAEECRVRWSPRGDAALAVTAAAVDSSGESYYGSADLYLLLATDGKGGSAGGGAISVPLPSGAPLSDASWNPNPSRPPSFCVISGKMPATASIHHGLTGDALDLYGTAHRNTISWSSPHGRFLNLGGFGNLAGGMDFWDVNKKKTMPRYDPVTGADTGVRGNTASCAVGYGWSPCGRYFMVSTTSPRMNVDNGVRVYKYNGADVTADGSVVGWDNDDYEPDRLTEAAWVPAAEGTYPDRPQTPPPRKSAAATEGGGAAAVAPAAAAASPAPAAYVPPAGRYVPPAARRAGGGGGGGGGGTTLADRMRAERQGGAATGVATKAKSAGGIPGMSGGSKKTPVGMAGGQPAKSKSAIKREKAKLAKERKEAAEREEAERKEAEQKEAERAKQEANKNDPEKRAKKIRKALKRIEELKGKDPGTLDEDQRSKIATEGELREELEKLGV